jgi:hypothetical protein
MKKHCAGSTENRSTVKKRISTTSIAKNALYFQELSLSHSFFPDPALK